MAARKRLRNTEELSPPASKQQKIDDFLLPQVPNLSKRRLNPDLELPDTSANRKLMGEVQFEVNPRDPSLHSMAQDLNHSPGKWDHTRNRLLEQTNLEQTTPSEPYGNKISQELYICPPKTLPASTVMEDLCIPSQLAPQHSLELPQMDYELDFHLFKDLQLGSQQDTKGRTWAQELSELMEKPHPSASSAIRSSPDGDIEGMEIIEVHNNGDSRSSATNNCCVFLDANKSLEKLIELD
uniref:Uncharacterized protein n=1 Tax=Sphaerodactylus townsendi TaxID=933632 RepID=A0ACB8FGW5_9SAUR